MSLFRCSNCGKIFEGERPACAACGYDSDKDPRGAGVVRVPGLTEGRIVHYVLEAEWRGVRIAHPGRHVAAVVVRVWDRESGSVNLRLFLDGYNDTNGREALDLSWEWRTSRIYDDVEKRPGTWHYPERAD